ncbi:MAG: GlxA family transcriptional regulator [Ferrovibrionaceae bacterium]
MLKSVSWQYGGGSEVPPMNQDPNLHKDRGQGRSRPLSVGFILAKNFTLSAFSLFVDHLRLAADEGDLSRPILARWSIMNSTPDPVRASCGTTISQNSGLTDPTEFDYIVVVGGVLHQGKQLDEESIAYLRQAAAAGVTLVGVCTGSFILCRAGLMDGRRVCVSWYHYQDFIEEFPDHTAVADRLYLIDGKRITCSGGGGSADLAAYLGERHNGRAVSQKARHVLLLDKTPRSITDIALEAGFSDGAHFSRQFRELYGKTPSEARAEAIRHLPEMTAPASLAASRLFD